MGLKDVVRGKFFEPDYFKNKDNVSASFKKLKIIKLKADGTKDKEIEVLLNPSSYSLDRSMSWSQKRVFFDEFPITKYKGEEGRSLSFELLYDKDVGNELTSSTTYSVQEKITELEELVDQDENTKLPPMVQLMWGDLLFTCVVSKFNLGYEKFDEGGLPLRVKVTLDFLEVEPKKIEFATAKED